jgi:sigma-B regulation protein RsbU (phosphoserine phosphatase)
MNQRLRDRIYLVAFLLLAATLLYLGADQLRQPVLLPWVITFSVTTVVAILALSLYRFKVQLDASRNELMRSDAELDFARKVQEALFPRKLPPRGGLEFTAVCIPARGISGDYYDIHELDDGRLMIVIADISGKGISAAILMANLQALVRVIAHSDLTPSEVCSRLNYHLSEVTDFSRFATLFYAEWHPSERLLRYVNAGHNPPFLVNDNKCLRLETGGIPLGIFQESDYETGEATLMPGDLLVLYSDGITEAGQSSGKEFGEERLRTLVQAGRDRPLPELQSLILDEVRRWTETEPDDDITLLMARVRPGPQKATKDTKEKV